MPLKNWQSPDKNVMSLEASDRMIDNISKSVPTMIRGNEHHGNVQPQGDGFCVLEMNMLFIKM